MGARIVTAEGELLQVNEESYPDLLWAIQGGGGNFGVVTQFDLSLHPIGPVVLALDVMYDYRDAKEVLLKAQQFNQSAPDEISFNTTIVQLPPAPFLPEFLHHKKVIMLTGMYTGDYTEGFEAIRPLRVLAQPIVDMTEVTTYVQLQRKLDRMVPDTVPVVGTSLYFSELNHEVLDILLHKVDAAPAPTALIQLWPLGGQMNRISSDATAFAVRDAGFVLLIDMMAIGTELSSCKQWTDSVYADLLPHSHKHAAYLNGIGLSENVLKNAFAGNYDRLLEVKRKYDPTNRFRYNHNIDPGVSS